MNNDYKKFVDTKLNASEKPILFVNGYIGKLMGSGIDKQYQGSLILTNQRVVFYSKTWLKEICNSVPIEKISSVEQCCGLLAGCSISIISNNDVIIFYASNSMNKILSEIQIKLDQLRNTVTT